MNVFLGDIAFGLNLIAIALGAGLFIYIKNRPGLKAARLATVIAYVVMIGAVLTLTCAGVNAYREYKNPGSNMYKMGPRGMRAPQTMGPQMMGPRMKPNLGAPPSSEKPE